MAIEIEHKFLLSNENWRQSVSNSTYYKQGYLSQGKNGVVRIRVSDNEAWLVIKGATIGTSRPEFTYDIPLAEAHELLDQLCEKPLIEKIRHFIHAGDHVWEIDEFKGDNEGLIVAEIELTTEGEPFDKPEWIGQEVTDDPRYYNNNLATNPFKNW